MFLSCSRTSFTEAGHSQARQESRSPLVANLKLEHNHAMDREAMAVKMWLAGKLTKEMQGQVIKLTGE